MKSKFYKGEKVNFKTYNFYEEIGLVIKRIKGTVVDVTDKFIVINNGYYNESFCYSELEPEIDVVTNTKFNPDSDRYDNIYYDMVIENCVDNLTHDKEGYVFNCQQVKDVRNILSQKNIDFSVHKEEDGIFYLKK